MQPSRMILQSPLISLRIPLLTTFFALAAMLSAPMSAEEAVAATPDSPKPTAIDRWAIEFHGASYATARWRSGSGGAQHHVPEDYYFATLHLGFERVTKRTYGEWSSFGDWWGGAAGLTGKSWGTPASSLVVDSPTGTGVHVHAWMGWTKWQRDQVRWKWDDDANDWVPYHDQTALGFRIGARIDHVDLSTNREQSLKLIATYTNDLPGSDSWFGWDLTAMVEPLALRRGPYGVGNTKVNLYPRHDFYTGVRVGGSAGAYLTLGWFKYGARIEFWQNAAALIGEFGFRF